jgi:hypothetical protein
MNEINSYPIYTFENIIKLIKDKDTSFNGYLEIRSTDYDIKNYFPINFVDLATGFNTIFIEDLAKWASNNIPGSIRFTLTVYKEDMEKKDGRITVCFQMSDAQMRDMKVIGLNDIFNTAIKRMVIEVLHYLLK